jgi:hypothetical protein
MTGRARHRVVVLVIASVAVATWILAAHTVGEELESSNAVVIGFAVALLAVAAAASLLLITSREPAWGLGLVLVLCGTACILAAVALQLYLASIAAQNSQRIVEILGEQIKTNPSARLNVNADYPRSVTAISYFAVFAGIWMAAVGARVGVGSTASPADATARPSDETPDPPDGS